ncbi:uncharacterized protein N7483_010860 [Penicillium malachiteum]|uniref:uncharacterized protein n=1 Tax=Penicillium malachiteum TaxID=1324776 RepID=UPI002547DD5A|nr:uncharacterized protein N7483_010860 [Penicillium malachiteum]KAJ5713679.1 hypothetical protein N7483_010860 [Penicillium malachiteum]
MLRKTRFVCVSDTHAYIPSEAGMKLPAGDVLIHAGDLTNKGSLAELRRTMDWISKADFEIKIIVAGNHDVTLDPEFYAKHGRDFHNSQLEDPRQCLEIVTNAAPSVIYLQHQAAIINLTRGPNTSFKIFGSPYSQFEGKWAFGYNNGKDATALWDQIPQDSDIVVTHTPPQSHCDQKPTGKHVGCNALRQALRRVRPPLAVCGHVHEGRGYQRVRWQLSTPINGNGDGVDDSHIDGDSDTITQGALPPPDSKKQALIDLTSKRGNKLDNEGYSFSASSSLITPDPATRASMSPVSLVGSAANRILYQAPSLSAGTHDLGCNDSDRPDAHAEQTLRRETCIVNAAILATSWPHRGGKRFNAPIIVDLELPVRQGDHASRSLLD